MYRMQPHSLHALEEQQRKKFCLTCLQDLKDDGFPADPASTQELETLLSISRQLEKLKLNSQRFQFRYFMAYYLLGPEFLEDPVMLNTLLKLEPEEEQLDFLELLIQANL